jgi:hypothetical protein
VDLKSAEFYQAAYLENGHEPLPLTAIYVCLEEEATALSAALALLHRVRQHRVPVVVRMMQEAGLAMLIDEARNSGTRRYEDLHAFGLLERICQPELVLGGTNEALARALHEQYLRDQEKLGRDASANPALTAWEKLTEALKETNRNAAGRVGVKLRAVGCDIAPLTDWDADTFQFTPEEVDRMAQMEHELWVSEHRALGWSVGPRDPQKKTNPSMVNWDELPAEIQEANRGYTRALPATLARAGFQIYRLGAS